MVFAQIKGFVTLPQELAHVTLALEIKGALESLVPLARKIVVLQALLEFALKLLLRNFTAFVRLAMRGPTAQSMPAVQPMQLKMLHAVAMVFAGNWRVSATRALLGLIAAPCLVRAIALAAELVMEQRVFVLVPLALVALTVQQSSLALVHVTDTVNVGPI